MGAIREAFWLDGAYERLQAEARRRRLEAEGASPVLLWVLRLGSCRRAAGFLLLLAMPAASALARTTMGFNALGAVGVVTFWLCITGGWMRPFHFEALRAPSLGALRIARLLRHLPLFVALAAGWFLGAEILLLEAGRPPFYRGIPYLAAAFPLAQVLVVQADCILQAQLGSSDREVGWVSQYLAWFGLPVLAFLLWPGTEESPSQFFYLWMTLFYFRPFAPAERSLPGRPPWPNRTTGRFGDPTPARRTAGGTPSRHRGRTGIRGAAAVRLAASYRIGRDAFTPLRVLRSVSSAIWAARGPLAAAGAVLLADGGRRYVLSGVFLLCLLAGTAPRLFSLPLEPRLHLLGMDARTHIAANLRALAFWAAGPTLLTAGILALALGAGAPGAAVVLLLAAVFLLRAGVESGVSRTRAESRQVLVVGIGIGAWLLFHSAGPSLGLFVGFGVLGLVPGAVALLRLRMLTEETARPWLRPDRPDPVPRGRRRPRPPHEPSS